MDASNFRLHEQIARGDLYELWNGTHTMTNTPVMLYILNHPAEPLHEHDRFEKYSPKIANIQHPHMLRYLTISADGHEKILIVVERPPGPNLREYLLSKPERRLSESDARSVSTLIYHFRASSY